MVVSEAAVEPAGGDRPAPEDRRAMRSIDPASERREKIDPARLREVAAYLKTVARRDAGVVEQMEFMRFQAAREDPSYDAIYAREIEKAKADAKLAGVAHDIIAALSAGGEEQATCATS